MNYDVRSFTATGTPVTSGATYKFGIDSVPGLAGSIKGSFYGPLAAETGGKFQFSYDGRSDLSDLGDFRRQALMPVSQRQRITQFVKVPSSGSRLNRVESSTL